MESDYGSLWVTDVSKDRFKSAFERYCRSSNIRSRVPDKIKIGRMLRKICPSVKITTVQNKLERVYVYRLPSLADARKDWDIIMKQDNDWNAN